MTVTGNTLEGNLVSGSRVRQHQGILCPVRHGCGMHVQHLPLSGRRSTIINRQEILIVTPGCLGIPVGQSRSTYIGEVENRRNQFRGKTIAAGVVE